MEFFVTYNVEIFNEDKVSLLNGQLSDFDTDIYHSPAWVQANQKLQKGSLFSILIESESNKAYFPLIKREIDNTEYFDLITPYGYGGIAFSHAATDEFKNNVLPVLYQYLEKTNCVSLFLRLHPLLNSGLDESAYIFENGTTLAVNLDSSFDEIKKNYSSGHRYDLKKSLKNEGISVVDDLNFEYFDQFIKIYTETMRLLNASDFYFFNNDYFYSLKEQLGNQLKLVVVKLDNVVIGASLFMLHNSIIQYHLSGTTSEGRNNQPSKLILDRMIEWGTANNYKYLHLGGGVGGAKDLLYKFKKGFSATEFEFSTVRMITNSSVYNNLCKALNYSKEEICNVSDFFPLYRK